MTEKHQQWGKLGGRPPKLSDVDIQQIRQSMELNPILARRYGVSIRTITRIRTGK